MAPRLDYDRSGVASRYDAGRQLSASARAAWATALGEAFGRIPAGLVIDVGCGTGRFAQVLLDDLGARVLGVEPAQEMARLARQSLPASARVLRAVAESLPLADATADGALLAFVYHHLTDPSAA